MKPLIISHRSLTPGATANVLSSLEPAARAGADIIELDVRLSLDLIPVVVHDAMLGAATNGRGWVGLWPSFALRHLRVAGGATSDRIPTLRDMLDACPPDVRLALHIKERRALGPVLRLLHQLPLPDQPWLWLEHARDVRTATRQLPPSRCTLLRPDGWQPFHRARYLDDARRVGAAAISVPWGVIDAGILAEAHRCQLLVFSRMECEQLLPAHIAAGLDGIITDDPALVRQHVFPADRS